MARPAVNDRPYVLGTGLDERERLGLQHRLWADAVHALWMRAGLTPGARVLDLGCGPGHASFELAQWVTSRGSVLGVDASREFVAYLEESARTRGLTQLRGAVADVMDLDETLKNEGPFDFVWARWLFCFVRDPARAIASVAARTRPGARFAIHDYFNYRAMTMAPRRASHDLVVEATVRSWRDNGGDPDVAARLPAMLEANGFRVEHLAVHQRVARGTDPMFAWPDTWWRTYAPKLVSMGYIAQADCDALLADLDALRASPSEYIVPPPVTELLAVRV